MGLWYATSVTRSHHLMSVLSTVVIFGRHLLLVLMFGLISPLVMHSWLVYIMLRTVTR